MFDESGSRATARGGETAVDAIEVWDSSPSRSGRSSWATHVQNAVGRLLRRRILKSTSLRKNAPDVSTLQAEVSEITQSSGFASSLRELCKSCAAEFQIPCYIHFAKRIRRIDAGSCRQLHRLAKDAIAAALQVGRPRRVGLIIEATDVGISSLLVSVSGLRILPAEHASESVLNVLESVKARVSARGGQLQFSKTGGDFAEIEIRFDSPTPADEPDPKF